jgi:signal peptidase II
LIVLLITLFVVLLDQASKLYIKGFAIPFLHYNHDGMGHGFSNPVIGDYFRITYVENPGMAFGIEITPLTKLLVSLFSILASIGLFYYLYRVRKQGLSLRISLALILGGAIGNLIDRVFYGVFYDYAPLFYGRVVDFLHFSYGTRSFPIFNVADSAVTIGVLTLLLFYKKHEETPVKTITQNEGPVSVENEAAPAINEHPVNSTETTGPEQVLSKPVAPETETPTPPETHEALKPSPDSN